ncbi:CDP-diacylglycerol--glycerol-3-phosphate 3-phosphatidyltransferase, mitochondrial [Culicoides brevitarsis]|uniref:CDP-diacylglycerol--glycerol-3-phosphate 3-phosphatidyltransferase, mitochondrial n=1 Tax=Culicoides brevitarsis TaxID=469753 RepID=UPI00307C22A8
MIRRFFSTLFEYQAAPLDIWPGTAPTTAKNGFFGKFSSLESLSWLNSCAPCFPVNGDKIKIIQIPSVFYETLVEKSSAAKFRIKLASLYLGTGQLEHNLVTAIHENLRTNKNLSVDILLDFTRGTRGEINSKTKVLPLLQESEKCVLSLYHTPVLRGITKKLAPPRWNELIGVQHMKVYLFDDTVILSGANLSNDYFTNRQDRYVMIEDKNVADFYSDFLQKVQEFSLQVDKNGNEKLHETWKVSPYEGSHQDFAKAARKKVTDFFRETWEKQNLRNQQGQEGDTWIFPTLEMGQIGIHHDSLVVRRILAAALPGSNMKMATGYFNLTDTLMNALTNECAADCNILMAHPNANGFLGAKGPAGSIPKAYTLIAKRYYDTVIAAKQTNRINLLEYERNGWTYHAKGLWYYLPNESSPSLTVIGSSNFGERSVNRDLETQICLVTSNERLKNQLQTEVDHLYSYGTLAQRELAERPIPRWVKAVVWLFKNFF